MPQNPDCYIDCPQSGYAYYVEPYGPCIKGCNAGAAGTALVALIGSVPPGSRFSGSIEGVDAEVLARFARDIVEHVPRVRRGRLSQLRSSRLRRAISTGWTNVDLVELIDILSEAAESEEPEPFA